MRSTWLTQAFSGLIPALALFATDIGYGWVAFSPLGMQHAHWGIVAAFMAATVGSIVPALVGGTGPMPSGARPAQTLIYASLLLGLVGSGADLSISLISGAVCVVLAGMLQLGMGLIGLGQAIKYTPMPVLAGFTNGVALSMVLAAGQMLFVSHGSGPDASLDLGGLPGKLGFMFFLLVLMSTIYRLDRRIHWSLIGLVAGIALYQVASHLGQAHWLGRTLPDTSSLHPAFPVFSLAPSDLQAAVGQLPFSELLPAALSIAVLNSLEALVIASQHDLYEGTRHNSNRVLLGQGLGNILGGLLGGLPSAPSNSRYRIARDLGGRTRLTGIAFGIAMFILLWLVPPLSGAIPTAALAAIMLYMAFSMVDDWTKHQLGHLFKLEEGRSIRRELSANLSVMAAVMLVAVLFNLVAAMVVGIVTAMFLFVRHHSRSIVARVYRGNHRHSSVMRPSDQDNALRASGDEIVLVELDGPLFFGSGESLLDEVERLSVSARHLILDFRHVDNIEASGAAALQRIARSLAESGIRLYIAGIRGDSVRARLIQTAGLRDHVPHDGWFPDIDHALEAAEDSLLRDRGMPVDDEAGCAWHDMDALRGLDVQQIENLRGYGQHLRLGRGAFVFRKGDLGNALYLVTMGRVEIRLNLHDEITSHRLVGLRPGTVFGELALLRGGIRSADAVVATEKAELLVMTGPNLDRLQQDRPDIARLFFRNIASLMAGRIASSSEDLRYALGGRH